ncbi:hypothetical protein HDF16_003287 [Granulicella aggregans]|uniref:DUF4252 domain-containing protein n=1 Tax=Granulicella aggregans TaxID=474949 RepID=A0A7W7ZF68_9BACT|nr:DUF4252 domain-containing protein [Granulicella aggregans]MBB5058573.1 hypothetical protein [Granulicella aggregans]
MNGRRRIKAAWLAAVLLLTVGARAMEPQVQDDLFAGTEKFAKGAKSSTEVNLDKNMLAMAGKFMDNDGDGDGDKQQKDLAKKMDFIVVREYEYAKAGEYNLADLAEFQKRLDAGGWSYVVKERSEHSSTSVCVKIDTEGQTTELIVIEAEPRALTFVHLKGHMTMRELTKIGAKYGVPQDDPKLKGIGK